MSEEEAADMRSLSEMETPVVVLDPHCQHHSIVASSCGFQHLTGFKQEDILGQPLDALLKGVPAAAISRSAWKNLANYCHSSRDSGIAWIGESSVAHPFGRKDGTVFMSLMTLGHFEVQGRSYVAAVHEWLSEGPVLPTLTQPRFAELEDANREGLKALRQRVCAREAPAHHLAERTPGPASGGVSFYTERLTEHTIVFSGGASAARREPEELPVGCLLFGSAPLKAHAQEGLRCSFRVDAVSDKFRGLPLVGFTKRRPVDRPGLYPRVAKGLAQSVLVGGFGEAFARRQEHNFEVGFRKVPQAEVASWCLQPEVPAHLRQVPAEVKPGDHIECRYTREGRIQFWLNSILLFGFDVDFPPDMGADYWPVLDICNSVCAMTLLGPCQASVDRAPHYVEAVGGHVDVEGECRWGSAVEALKAEALKRQTSFLVSDASTASEIGEWEGAPLGLDDEGGATAAFTLVGLAAAVLGQKGAALRWDSLRLA